jgi:hypothetical protein
MLLACNVGLAGFSLGMKGVERLIETFFRRFAGVDSTPDSLHCFLPFVPKKAGLDQCVPVIRQAIGDRLLNISPSYSKPVSVMVTS